MRRLSYYFQGVLHRWLLPNSWSGNIGWHGRWKPVDGAFICRINQYSPITWAIFITSGKMAWWDFEYGAFYGNFLDCRLQRSRFGVSEFYDRTCFGKLYTRAFTWRINECSPISCSEVIHRCNSFCGFSLLFCIYLGWFSSITFYPRIGERRSNMFWKALCTGFLLPYQRIFSDQLCGSYSRCNTKGKNGK